MSDSDFEIVRMTGERYNIVPSLVFLINFFRKVRLLRRFEFHPPPYCWISEGSLEQVVW